MPDQPGQKLLQIPASPIKKSPPDFLLKNSDGKTINTATQKGKILFINFWATSCIPCVEEMPGINRLHNHFLSDTNVLILPIDVDDNFTNSVDFMKKYRYTLPVYNSVSRVPEAYFHGVLPTTVLIDKKGRIAKYYEGQMDYGSKEFIGLVDSLLKETN